MLAGGQAEEPAASEPGGDASLSQEEIQAMLAGAQPEPAAPESGGDAMLSQEEIQAMLAGGQPGTASQPEPVPVQQPAPAPLPMQQPVYQQAPAAMDPMMMQLMTQMQQSQMQMMEMMNQMRTEKPAQVEGMRPNTVVHPVNSPKFAEDTSDGVEEAANKELLMKVPLEISVEIGRTRKLVKDILEFTQGSLVVLDKMAGERADVFVNGECIARGDIVVVEDNFGIRITEIVSRNLNPEAL